MLLTTQMCQEIEDLDDAHEEIQEQLETAVRNARIWLAEQDQVRRRLFARLEKAVAQQRPGQVRRLLLRANATAAHGRTGAEDDVVERATDYFASLDDLTLQAVKAEAATEKEAQEAAANVRRLLRRLHRYDAYTPNLRSQVEGLIRAAAAAGDRLKPGQARDVEVWKRRKADGPQNPLHRQVARRYWIQRNCPRCHADQGKNCVLVEGADVGKVRDSPHNERLQPIVDERIAKQKKAQPVVMPSDEPMQPATDEPKALERPRLAYEVTCPTCGRGYNSPCESPSGPHRSRVELAKEYTRLGKVQP
ncbi:hypothetical protein ACFQ93_30110 [Streptomyces sp. NPDC056601]|uniref:zinc finger domain-containing protein n=1 Tax=Streptomyces sp. NPDC056601 TaxID=3345875 RepID=UPI00369FA762